VLESVCIHLSNSCNLECEYCWTNSSPSGREFISYDSIIRFVDEVRCLGLTRISLSGGEPLMHPKVDLIISELLSRGLLVDITTNGTLLPAIKRVFSNISRDQRDNIKFRVSIDGPKKLSEKYRGSDTYDKSISSLVWLKENLGNVFVNSVVPVSIDLQEWVLFVKELHKIGVSQVALISLSPRGRGEVLSDEFVKIHRNILDIEAEILKQRVNNFIFKWDYLTVSHGYLIVEHNGDILLPAIQDLDDISVGNIELVDSYNLAIKLKSHRKRLNYNMSK